MPLYPYCCEVCGHTFDDILTYEDRDKPTKQPCPKCGDESWNAASNVHKVARLHSVKSITSRNKSALNDSRDYRDEKYYTISTHFNFNSNTIQGTWGMKMIPFGIEYVKDVELIQLNLGASDVVNARHIRINQLDEIPRHGFVTCKHCGKSTSNPREVVHFEKKFHYGYCKHKDAVYKEMSDEVFEEVYLMRNVHTEAIKILLPVQEFLSEAIQRMFKAGLELGLKKYYKGNPQHIAFDFYSEYNHGNDRFDRYLVAYDTIPGGTGYLQKLFDPTEFTLLLNESYKAIRDCSCKDSGKDGCYRCILTYANQYIREDLSREKAEELFGRIVNNSKEWEEINQGLSSMTKSGQIEESELELKFIQSLRIFAGNQEDKRWSFAQSKEEGTVIYHLSLPTVDGSITYVIRPQISLGKAQGVAEPTRSDFYFKCVKVTRGEDSFEEGPELEAFKDIAIYMDGYTFHASNQHMRFYQDMKIRNAITETPNIRPWVLSWSDLTLFDNQQADSLFLDENKYRETLHKLNKVPLWKSTNKELIKQRNSLERMLWYLCNSNDDQLATQVGAFAAGFQTRFATPSFTGEEATKLLNPENLIDNTSKVDTIILLKANVPTPSENNTEMKVWGLFFRNDMYNALCGNLGVGANTSTPSQKLEINGNMLLRNGGATHNHIIIGENGKPNRAAVVQNGLYYNNTLMYQGIFSHNAMLTSGNDATFEKINPTNKALFIEMNGSEYNMTFCSLGGQSAPFVRGSLVRFGGNGLVGIGTENPQATLHISSLLKLEPTLIPPLPHTEGMIYYDSTTNKLKVYTGSIWEEIN